MKTKWRQNRCGDRRRELGHGLVLTIWYESNERVPSGAPGYNVGVFGQRLVTRAADVKEAKRRAEVAARRWLHEALLKL